MINYSRKFSRVLFFAEYVIFILLILTLVTPIKFEIQVMLFIFDIVFFFITFLLSIFQIICLIIKAVTKKKHLKISFIFRSIVLLVFTFLPIAIILLIFDMLSKQ